VRSAQAKAGYALRDLDRLVAHELTIKGDSYRRRRKPSTTRKLTPTPVYRLTNKTEAAMLTDQTRWSLGHGKPLVSSRWQATP
jgi:hypothetical protein